MSYIEHYFAHNVKVFDVGTVCMINLISYLHNRKKEI